MWGFYGPTYFSYFSLLYFKFPVHPCQTNPAVPYQEDENPFAPVVPQPAPPSPDLIVPPAPHPMIKALALSVAVIVVSPVKNPVSPAHPQPDE